MSKRKKSKTKNNSKILTYIAWTLAVIALILSALVAGYYFGYEDGKTTLSKKEELQKEKRLALLRKLEKNSKIHKSVNNRLKEVLKKETKKLDSHEFDDTPLALPPKAIQRKIVRSSRKPKLAIIIDDVGTRRQVEAIKSLHIPLTMSFLPPSQARPNTSKLASKEKFYMVHLPMEAMHWNAEEPLTLRVGDSQQKISARITQLKKLFPKVHYINNHTGSKFTSDERAMNRLIFALNKNHINFIDSRTTAKTKAPKVMKNFGFRYMARDVFLDHHMDKAYVLKQIKQAVKVAKLHGTAIAIGHPHKNTIQALKESSAILNEVDLVYVNRLY